MSNDNPLKTLLGSTRQYHSRKLLKADEYISLLSDTLSTLHLTSKIDLTMLSQEIRNFVMILDWFGHISTKITQNFYDWGLHINLLEKDGSKLQYRQNSDEFVNYIITEYIEKKHKKHFGTTLPALHSHQGINLSDITGDWHTVTQDNGITLTIETIVSSLIEYERSYMSQLANSGTLQTLQNIHKVFSNMNFNSPEEAIIVQVLEQCTELYLTQYEISSILLPFHLGEEGVSINLDKIYEKYSPAKNLTVRKTIEMINVLKQDDKHLNDAESKRIMQELENLADDVITESTTNEWEHPGAEQKRLKKVIRNIQSKSEKKQRVPKKTKQTKLPLKDIEKDDESQPIINDIPVKSHNTETVHIKELQSFSSSEQPMKIFDEPDIQKEVDSQSDPLTMTQILEKYCEEKLSDDKYRIAGEFYLMKEYGRYSLVMHNGHKTIGKGDEAFEEPIYKRVSKTPYFVVAKTVHLQSGNQGVQLVAVNNDKLGEYTSLTLGDADSKKVKTALRNKGILIESPKLNSDYIDSMYQTISRQLFISDNVGWVEHAGQFGFVLPNKFGIGINGLEYSGKNANLLHAIETKGNLEAWLSIFESLDLEKAHPRIAFLLFSSLLPLFAGLHDTFEGFVINITPDYSEGKGSSNGKTTLQQLMLSIQGSVEHWHTNWNKTALAMEDYLYTNVGAYFDDTSKTKMKAEELEDLIYSISDAQSRGSSRQSARTRKTVMYSTGEKDFLQHTGKDGVYVRYVDIGIKRNDYGSNDTEETRKIVDHIKKTVVSHYGFVYPEAIKIFLANKDDILERTDIYIDKMAEHGRYDNASRIAKRYAMIAICGEIFIDVMRSLTGDSNLYSSLNSFEISLNMFKVHDQKLIEMEQSQGAVSENLLSELLNKFSEDEQHTLYDKDGKAIGFVEEGNMYYIQSKVVTGNLPDKMTKKDFFSKIDKALVVDSSKGITRKYIENGKSIRYDIFREV